MQQWIEDVARRVHIIQVMCRTSHASLWLVRDESIELLAGELTLPVSRAIQSIWVHCAHELHEGRTIEEDGFTLVPLDASVRLTGILALAGALPADDLDRPYIDKLLPRLALLLASDPVNSPRSLSLTVSLADLARPQRGKLRREAVESVLAMAQGNITHAARWLGVSRQTMYNICDRVGIPIRRPRSRA